MGQQQSVNKDELLYQQVNYGDSGIESIKSLFHQGAGLEWFDKEGKTPLIAACLNAELYNVAKTLIDLGANVNAYRPGIHAGTPLHHAAKRGLEQTVKLLLSHGANASVMNDDCQTAIDVARAKGYTNVVRTIERHVSLFLGWLRELHGPGFLEALTSQWLSKKIWAVVIPSGSRNPAKPLKLQLVIYSTPADARPRTIIALWKAKIEQPKFHQSDPTLIILDDHTKTRYKFASANEGDKYQLQCFYNACIGISQVMCPSLPVDTTAPLVPATAPPTTTEDLELDMAISASMQSAMVERPPQSHPLLSSGGSNTNDWINPVDNSSHNAWSSSGGPAPASKGSSNGWSNEVSNGTYNGWVVPEVGSSSSAPQQSIPSVAQITHDTPGTTAIPSAPPILEGPDNEPVHYPVIDSSPIDLPVQSIEGKVAATSELKEDGSVSSTCVICLDAPIEGACIPCGHMAGCMSCLNEIQAKKWGCPVCRAKIQQVIRLYAV
ncbi:hypothetical protein FRX31_014771 [Thalictrum thalictroides]|uniref:RING-type domain-containing protein n=1 Tax=Thalictrum thalictroides TaxID=46969 RepID=A0A7J6WDX5_THATH|nr:hypothetical protein FRX31_014771 [Thalictrum thalictroides]